MSRRRSPGEGAAYRLDDGTWRGFVDLGWRDGRRRRKYVRGRTKADVLQKVRKLTAEAEAGRLSPDRAPTLGAWLDRYLTEVAATTVRPSTLHRYRQEVRLYIGPGLGKVPIDQLRPAQVSRFYQDQLRRLSPGSVRRLHALLRRSLTIAVRWQLIHTNPVMAVDPPALAVAEVEPYSVSEARAFLAAIRGERFEARWVLAITLGLRQGEVLGLGWCDVDLDRAVLRVRQALQYRPGAGLQLVQPKTIRSRRTVPLPAFLVSALKLHRKNQGSERDAAGEFWEDWGLIFTTHVGTPLSPRNDYRDFRRIVAAAGLRQLRLHDLRHTAASLMLARGVAPRVIMEVLGHSQISVTMNTYSHVSPVLSREAADQIEVLFGAGFAPLAAAEAAEPSKSEPQEDEGESQSWSD